MGNGNNLGSQNKRVRLIGHPSRGIGVFSSRPTGSHETPRVGKGLRLGDKQRLKDFLNNLDFFARKHRDMVGIDSKVSCYHLNINPKFTHHLQKRIALNPERYETLKEEVQRLEDNGFNQEAISPK